MNTNDQYGISCTESKTLTGVVPTVTALLASLSVVGSLMPTLNGEAPIVDTVFTPKGEYNIVVLWPHNELQLTKKASKEVLVTLFSENNDKGIRLLYEYCEAALIDHGFIKEP